MWMNTLRQNYDSFKKCVKQSKDLKGSILAHYSRVMYTCKKSVGKGKVIVRFGKQDLKKEETEKKDLFSKRWVGKGSKTS